MQKIRTNLTYANVAATLALFLALSGGVAVAASHLARNSVGTRQLRRGAVTRAKIKAHAVTGAKLKLSTLGKVPSASRADNADTLQGNPASAFLQGGGRFVSGHREVAVGESGVELLQLPGMGRITASCAAGKTYAKGTISIFNEAGSAVDLTLQYAGGNDGGTVANGASTDLGGNEYVDAWTVQLATRADPGKVATINASFLKEGNTACEMIAQATIAGA